MNVDTITNYSYSFYQPLARETNETSVTSESLLTNETRTIMSNLSSYNFDASTIEPSNSYDPIPAGWYQAIISNSEMKPTRDGYGEHLSLTLQKLLKVNMLIVLCLLVLT